MSWFREVKPPFLVSRLFGMAPYSFAKGLPSHSKAIRILSSIVLVARMCEWFFRIYHHMTTESSLQLKLLLIFRSSITSSVFITEGFVCLRCTNDLKTAIDHIEQYDRALSIDFATKSIVIRAWFHLAVPSFYLIFLWSIRPTETESGNMYGLYYAIRGIGWFATTLKFLEAISSLKRRFHHLDNILTKGTSCIIDEADGAYRPLRLKDVCRLHGNLILAAKGFNSMHNMILLLWICESSLFVTLEIYSFFNDHASDTYEKSWHTGFYVAPDLTFLIYLFTICHNTAAAANKIGWVALSPKSCVLRGRFVFERDEGFVIGQWFILHPLHFTAAYGLFRIELPLLGTIFGAMTTVLVILCG